MSKLNIKPLGTRVLIEAHEAEVKTKSGIFIPDTAQEKPMKGTVVAIGPGTKKEEMQVKPGDVVLYGKYAGTTITVEGKDYLMMNQSEIFAIL